MLDLEDWGNLPKTLHRQTQATPNEKFLWGPGAVFSKRAPGRRRHHAAGPVLHGLDVFLCNVNHLKTLRGCTCHVPAGGSVYLIYSGIMEISNQILLTL
jgi:hypothetical protein